jgi:hypothetical protein
MEAQIILTKCKCKCKCKCKYTLILTICHSLVPVQSTPYKVLQYL